MKTWRSISRLFTKIRLAKRPGFIFSIYYFHPFPTPMMALHRQLFFLSCRHPIRLALNGIAYIRWVGYYSWVSCYKACKTRTPEQLIDYGLSRRALYFALLRLAIGNLIAPHYYFKYQLYKKEHTPFDYLYNQELPQFHDLSNKHLKDFKAAAKLIGDKDRFSHELRKIGLPAIHSESFNTNALQEDPSLLFRKQRVFCKPNTGSQSTDTFLIDYVASDNSYRLEPIQGQTLSDPQEIDHYLQKIIARNKNLLVQPVIVNHSEIKKIAPETAATTVRIITAKRGDSPQAEVELIYLQLEIPNEKTTVSSTKNKINQFYTILPLDLKTLDVDPMFKQKTTFPEKCNIDISEVLKHFLRESIEYCMQAHQQLLNLRTVSFDVIIGEEGPIIIEANYNWSIELLYFVVTTNVTNAEHTHPSYRWLQSVAEKKTYCLQVQA